MMLCRQQGMVGHFKTIFELGTPENPMMHIFLYVVSNFIFAAYDITMTLHCQPGMMVITQTILELDTPEIPHCVFWHCRSHFIYAAYEIIVTLRRLQEKLGQL